MLARRIAACVLLAAAPACSDPPQRMNATEVTLRAGRATTRVKVEVAETDRARMLGLMNRSSVPDGTGMLFRYPGASRWGGIWMKDTLVSLDVAFARDGVIFEIHTLEPCRADPCPVTRPAEPFDRVLEVPGGWLAQQGFGVGTTLTEPA